MSTEHVTTRSQLDIHSKFSLSEAVKLRSSPIPFPTPRTAGESD